MGTGSVYVQFYSGFSCYRGACPHFRAVFRFSSVEKGDRHLAMSVFPENYAMLCSEPVPFFNSPVIV